MLTVPLRSESSSLGFERDERAGKMGKVGCVVSVESKSKFVNGDSCGRDFCSSRRRWMALSTALRMGPSSLRSLPSITSFSSSAVIWSMTDGAGCDRGGTRGKVAPVGSVPVEGP